MIQTEGLSRESINQPLRDVAVGINAPVAQEWPVRAGLIHMREVNGRYENLFRIHARLRDDFSRRARDKALPPELDAIAAYAFEDFVASAVHGGHVAAVGDGVAALNELPRAMLFCSVRFFLRRMPADGGGVEKNLRALQRRQSRAFRIPLVPANQDADLAVTCLPGAKAEIAGREIEFLVIKWIVRDVHLPICAEQRAVCINDGGGVVIETGGAFLEERSHNDHFVFFCELLKCRRTRARNCFSEFEVLVVFALAEVMRGEQFLRADDLCALLCGALCESESFLAIGCGICGASVLQ